MTATSPARLRRLAERAGYSFAPTPTSTPRPRSTRTAPRWQRWLLAGGVLFSVALVAPAAQSQSVGPFVDVPRTSDHPFAPAVTTGRYLVVGDIDDDGDEDLFLSDEQGEVIYYEQTAPSVLVEQPASPIAQLSAFDLPQIVDVDGDGAADLLYARRVEARDADGVFVSVPSLLDGIVPAEEGVRRLADVDGDLDLLLVEETYYSTTVRYFDRTAQGFEEVQGAESPVANIGRLFQTFQTSDLRVEVADLDGDGDPDLSTGWGLSGGSRVYLLDEDDQFEYGGFIVFDEGLFVPTPADLDGDGDIELLAYEPRYLTSDYAYVVQFEKADPANAASYVPIGRQRGALGGQVIEGCTERINVCVSTMALGDLDSDGDADLIAASYYAIASQQYTAVTVFEQQADGRFEVAPDHPLSSLGPSDGQIAVGDLDGDGRDDLVTRASVSPTEPYHRVLLQKADGTFEEAPDHPLTAFDFDFDQVIALADVDLDGRTDAILGYGGKPIRPALQQPDGTFAVPKVNPFLPFEAQSEDRLTFADYDGDGDLDVLRLPQRRGISEWRGAQFWEQTDPLTFEEREELAASLETVLPFSFTDQAPTAGDVDGDGDTDLLLMHNGTVEFIRNDATAVADEPAALLPDAPALDAAYPNPFREAATLTLALPEAQPVRVALYDVLGRQVALLHDGAAPAGTLTMQVDGAGLASGVYVVRAEGRTFAATQRLTHVE